MTDKLCYCFNFTKQDIVDEIKSTGQTTIPDYIRKKIKEGACECETLNPKGTCCLGDISKAVKEAPQ